MKKALGLCFILCFISLSLFADTIVLKSGKRIEGSIVERSGNYIKVEVSGTTLTYFIDEIATINEGAVTGTAPATTSPAVPPAALMAEPQEPSTRVDRPDTAASGTLGSDAPIGRQNRDSTRKSPANTTDGRNTIDRTNPFYEFLTLAGMGDGAMYAALGVFAVVFFVFCIFFYVYGAICLYLISKKTGKGTSLLAWIPIANLFLMCKIADLSYFWLFALFLLFIPIIGGMLVSAGFVVIWYRIAQARGKPGWLGIITIVPLANLVVMGYLAFSE